MEDIRSNKTMGKNAKTRERNKINTNDRNMHKNKIVNFVKVHVTG